MQRNSRPELSFRFQKDEIILKAEKAGDPELIETWRKAFPNIDFPDIIDNTDIYWEAEFSLVEIAAYVAIMTNTEMARISYLLSSPDDDFDNEIIAGEVDELTLLLNCWIAHLFDYFDEGEQVSDQAEELLLQYATEERMNGRVYRSSTAEGPAFLDTLDLYHDKVSD